jgi:protein TonB
MRRRRQKNPLLMRIIVVSVAVHIVALPILAHFGAFKKIQEHFVEAKIVVLPPPDRPKLQQEKIKQVKKPPVVAHTAHAGSHAHGSKPNPNQVHIAIAKGGGAEDGGPGAQQGEAQAGVIPTDTGTKSGSGTGAPVVADTTPKEKANTPTAPTAPVVVQHETVAKPIPPVIAPVAPHVPMFTEAAPIEGHQPQPTIPDDFRSDALDTTVVVDVTVGPDGTPTAATIAQSTGKRDLDRLAVDAAKQWRFKPATRDGEPVESRVRLHIEFQVS